MLQGIDHLVIACEDLDASAVRLEEEVGLAIGGGGRHESLGTENRLAWLGDTYLELLSVVDPGVASRSWIGRPALAALDRGGGFVTCALATDDLAADLQRLRAGGSRLGDPQAGERRRDDGELVRWRLAAPAALGPDQAPFLIEHEPTGSEWGPAARDARAHEVHPLGGTARLRRLEIAVGDPGAVATRWRGDAGVVFGPPGSSIVDAPVGPARANQTVRLLPARGDRPAAGVVIAISSGRPRQVDLLGCRFILEPADD